MFDVALRAPGGASAVALGSGGPVAPPLPVAPALSAVLPHGLRRGSTVTVSGSISLLLALLGAASAGGAWCALVGFPTISAEAAAEYGIALPRLAVVNPSAGPAGDWTTAVGALLDAVDIVAVRPPVDTVAVRPPSGIVAVRPPVDTVAVRPGRVAPGDVRRLAARARTRAAVLVPFVTGPEQWPGADVRLQAADGEWSGIGAGTGRLRARRVHVTADGRGPAARPRSAQLWLPAPGGGAASAGHDLVAIPRRWRPERSTVQDAG